MRNCGLVRLALVHDDSGREGPGVDGVGDALPNEVQLGLGRAALIVRGRLYQFFQERTLKRRKKPLKISNSILSAIYFTFDNKIY